jgi:ribonucleotide monophosphatase NagD (HAD superfamily)
MSAAENLQPGASDARAARAPTPVQIHLTNQAHGCAKLGISDPRRWRTFYGKPQISVMRALLTRLRLAPGSVRIRDDDPPEFDVDLMAAVDGEWVPVAVICTGISAAEAKQLLQFLVDSDWKPSTLVGEPL